MSTCDDTFEDSGLEQDLEAPCGSDSRAGALGGLCEGPRDPLSGVLRVEDKGQSTRSSSMMDIRMEEISSKRGRRNSLPGFTCQGT